MAPVAPLAMEDPKPQPRRLLKVKQASHYLSISPWKLRKLIQDGEIPYLQDGDYGPFLLDIRDLDEFVEKHKKGG
jgi:excisionase family DNA binding protein